MCSIGDFFGGNDRRTTTTQDPTTRAARNVSLQHALSILSQSFPGYNHNERTAGLNRDHSAGFNMIRGLPGVGRQDINAGTNLVRRLSGPGNRIVDQNGPLGRIDAYMNPMLQRALNPALRDIRQSGQQQRNEIGAGAMSANAFGDARHGVVEGEQMRGENQEVGDLSSTMRYAAYDDAMQRRSADRDYLMNAGLTRIGIGNQQRQNVLNDATARLGVGDRWRNVEQERRDAKYEEYLRGTEWPFRQLDALMSVISGNPTSQTVTQSGGGGGLWQLLGALGGGFLGGM